MSRNRHFGAGYCYFGEDGYGQDIRFYGDAAGHYLFWDASAYTLYLGTNTHGADFKAFGATTGKYMLWDESENKLVVAGDLTASGAVAFGANLTEFTVSTAGAVVAASTIKSTGNFTVGADKFVVTAASGNLLSEGTIGAGANGTEFTVGSDGALAIATSMFTVSAVGALSAKGAVAFGANLTEFGISTAGDITSYNKEADATGVYWLAKKSRAAGAACQANDVVWQADFQGMNATPVLKTVASIAAKITNIGAGTEAGSLTFSTMIAGAAIAEAFRVGATVNSVVDFTVATDKFTVAAATGKTTITHTSAVVGLVEPFVLSSTLTGPGATGGRARFALDANVALGGWANALKAITTFGATGRITGLASAFCGELVLSAGTTQGTYAPIESELVANTGASLGTATSFFFGDVGGTAASDLLHGAYLLELGPGCTIDTDHIVQASAKSAINATHAIRIRVVEPQQ